MENQKPLIKNIALSYGLYLSLISIAGIIILYILNEEQNWVLRALSFILSIVIYVYGIKTYKSQNNNFLSIKEALKVGLAIAVISGIITAIYAFVHYTFIQPEYFELLREKSYEQMSSQNPNMTQEQLDTAIKMTSMFTSKFFITTILLIRSLFSGFIISLIIGAIMKKTDPEAN